MAAGDCVVSLDLRHDGLEGAIAAHVLEAPDPVLVDPGPSASMEELRAGLRAVGLAVGDLRHVLLTHVHLDHAGATGHLVRENPRIRVHVHADGAPHLVDPERLVRSTRRTFGEAHDRLWGEVLPVPAGQVAAWSPGGATADAPRGPRRLEGGPGLRRVRAVPSPGHIAHHLSFLSESDGTLLAGDSLGIILDPEAPTHPATPPPAVDLAAWRETLLEEYGVVAALGVERLALSHFGLLEGARNTLERRRHECLEVLEALEDRVAAAMARGEEAEAADRDAFHQEAVERAGPFVGPERAERYFRVFSAATDWAGVRFHLARR